MHRLKIKKHAFTLAETVIVCSVFAVMVVGIILMINRAYVFMNDARVAVMATNFAREGVEMIYNIRDTNWRKYSGMKDANWATGFLNFRNDCVSILKEEIDSNGNSVVSLESVPIDDANGCGIYKIYGSADDFFESIDKEERNFRCKYKFKEHGKMTYSGTYSYYSGGEVPQGEIRDLFKGNGTEFYRIVSFNGSRNKIGGNRVFSPEEITDGTPIELRFCVQVYYRNHGNHKKELCSIMTNFME